MISDYIAASLDRSIYQIGLTFHMDANVRKWKNRPALAKGELVTIRAYRSYMGQYGPIALITVETQDGRIREIEATKLNHQEVLDSIAANS